VPEWDCTRQLRESGAGLGGGTATSRKEEGGGQANDAVACE